MMDYDLSITENSVQRNLYRLADAQGQQMGHLGVCKLSTYPSMNLLYDSRIMFKAKSRS